eukprot:6135689-Amphidinium_carterae.1
MGKIEEKWKRSIPILFFSHYFLILILCGTRQGGEFARLCICPMNVTLLGVGKNAACCFLRASPGALGGTDISHPPTSTSPPAHQLMHAN